MLLAIDIGNTSIAAGIFQDDKLIKYWKIKSQIEKTCDEYTVTLTSLFSMSVYAIKAVNDVILCSVVPPLTPVFQKLSLELFGAKAMIVGPGLKTGMSIKYENPGEVGADRVVSAVAAYEKFGGPCIVVDFGTAATFDVISAKGEYLGGAIAPGIHISAEALYLKTAKLPHIEIKKPDKAVGRTTVASMQSGLYYGYIGLVSNIIEAIRNEIGGNIKVVATGGFAPLFCDETGFIDCYEPNLVLQGLRILYARNRKTGLLQG